MITIDVVYGLMLFGVVAMGILSVINAIPTEKHPSNWKLAYLYFFLALILAYTAGRYSGSVYHPKEIREFKW